MNALTVFSDRWSQTLWSLSWQIAILVGFVAVVALASRRTTPNFRYWLWMIVLARLCVPINVTLPFGIAGAVQLGARTSSSAWAQRLSGQAMNNADEDVRAPRNHLFGEKRGIVETGPTPSQLSTPHTSVLPWRVALLLAWLGGVTLMAATVLYRFVRVRRFLKDSPRAEREDLCALLERLCETLGIRRSVDLRCFPAEHGFGGPVVVGFVHPGVILPQRMAEEWRLEELEPVLLHELAHVRRNDLLVNWLQIFVQTAFFFHPLVWFANWRIRHERELICDDLAVFHAGARRKEYSQSILRVLEEMKRGAALAYAGIGMTEPKSSLGRRIIRIMDAKYQSYKPLGKLSLAALLLLGALGIAIASEKATSVTANVEAIDSKTRELGEAVKKRLTTWTDETTVTLQGGETARMRVKENTGQIGEILITPHVAAEGTTFTLGLIDEKGEPVEGAAQSLPNIHDGTSERTGLPTGATSNGRPVICKIQLTPMRQGAGRVQVGVSALFCQQPTIEETKAMLSVKGKDGRFALDVWQISDCLSEYQRRHGQYPQTLAQLNKPLPKDAYSPRGDDYHYEASGRRFIISSCGEDGVYGNDDDMIQVRSGSGGRTGMRNEIYPLEDGERIQEQSERLGPTNRRPQGASSIGGRVIDAITSEPISHATVYLMDQDALDAIFINVAGDGSFVFKDIASGPYTMRVIHTGGYTDVSYDPEYKGGEWPQFKLEENEHRKDIVLSLKRAYSIEGHIVTENGVKLPSFDSLGVLAWGEQEHTGGIGECYRIVQQTNVRPDGSYALDGLEGRPVYVMVQDWQASKRDDPIPPVYYPGVFSRDEARQITFDGVRTIENADIRVKRTGGAVLEGTVRGESSGAPIADAMVVAHHEDMLFDDAVDYTDSEGHYRFECLGPGRFLVHVDASPYGLVRTRKALTVEATVNPMPLDFSLKTGATITGRFVDETAQPWKVEKKFGNARVEGLGHAGGSFTGRSHRKAAALQNPEFYPGEGDYESSDMAFPDDSSFVIQGMMPGQVVLQFKPYVKGKAVVAIKYNGVDVRHSGIAVKPGQTTDGVTIVIGAAANAPDDKLSPPF